MATSLDRRRVSLIGLISAFVVSACRRDIPTSPTAITIEAYAPHGGDVWTFVNGYGDTTTIATEIAPDPVACRSGNNIIWHYRKSQSRAYWNPGIQGAEILFVLHQNPDGSWRSTASVISFPLTDYKVMTWDILDNPPGVPLPYQIAPPRLHRGDHLMYETLADAVGGPGLFTLNCVVPEGALTALPGHGEQWRTEYYMEDLSTPIYAGPTSVSEQWENCAQSQTNVGCGHEKWWFAPDLGLVKVQQFNTGSGIPNDVDPRVTMVRVK
jgi:hypothetical protein